MHFVFLLVLARKTAANWANLTSNSKDYHDILSCLSKDYHGIQRTTMAFRMVGNLNIKMIRRSETTGAAIKTLQPDSTLAEDKLPEKKQKQKREQKK